MEKLVVIDGNSLINRAFYALPLLSNKDGEYSNAVYGFVNMLIKIIQEHNPTHIAVAFDFGKKTFRNKLYEDYKGTRKGTPEELKSQFPILKKILSAMSVKTIEIEGIEADDIIGVLTKKFDLPTVIFTGDKDSLQLIDGTTEVWLTKKGISDVQIMNEKTLKETMGLEPYQIIEMKALMGDSSDNIPGVAGVGEKTALDLLSKYKHLDGVYEHIDEIKGKLQEKLVLNKDTAYLSKQLATIITDYEIDVALEEMTYDFPFSVQVYEYFKQYDFNSLLKKKELFEGIEEDKDFIQYSANIIELAEIAEIAKTLPYIEKAKRFNFEISADKISFAYDKNCEYFINISEGLEQKMHISNAIQAFKEIFENPVIKKTVYDCKQIKHKLAEFGISLFGVDFDCMLADYLIFAGDKQQTKEELIAQSKLSEKYEAINLFYLKEKLEQTLSDLQLEKLYWEVEFPLTEVLYKMEKNGFKIDIGMLGQLSDKYKAEMEDVVREIYMQAGEEFNVNSPKQLASVLFEKLGLGVKFNKKMSTSIEILEQLYDVHPIVPLIIRYRKIQKLSSTYLEAYKTIYAPETHMIHTIFNQTLTATGRLSSSEPNLQNLPVRDEEGKSIRRIFISSFEGGKIVSADYSQIELRLLAHFSQDPTLLMAYRENRDIHTQTASEVFGVDFDSVTSKMRRDAKAVNFGIVYGISDYGLAQNIGCTRKQAKEYIDKYFERYSSVKNYMAQNVDFAKQNGYISTLLGRRRRINELFSSNYMMRQFGERVAMNMPLQGSASDIIKVAMIKVDEELKNRNLESKLILQVHDELIIDAKADEVEQVCEILRTCMMGAVELSIPLEVDVSAGDNWFDC